MTKDEILADLHREFPGAKVLTSDQVARVLATTPAAIANMRHRGTFPIEVKKVGSRVCVSVYDLAEFLATGSVVSTSKAPSALVESSSARGLGLISPSSGKRSKGKYDWLLAFRRSIDFQERVYAELERLLVEETLSLPPVNTEAPYRGVDSKPKRTKSP